MGVEYSVLIQKELENAALNQLLENQKFLNVIEYASKDLSSEALANLRKIFGRSLTPSIADTPPQADRHVPNTRQLQPLVQAPPYNEQVLAQAVASLNLNGHAWTNLFLDYPRALDPFEFLQDLFCSCSSILAASSPTSQKARWRRRFLLCFFYQLHRLHNADGNFNKRACEVLKGALRPYVNDQKALDLIDGELGKWVRRGQRYKSLCESLNSSAILFCLPENVPDSFWEQSLPLTGTMRMVAIDLLHQKGIVALARNENLRRAAQSVEDGLIQPFKPTDANCFTMDAPLTNQHFSPQPIEWTPFSNVDFSPECSAVHDDGAISDFSGKNSPSYTMESVRQSRQYLFINEPYP